MMATMAMATETVKMMSMTKEAGTTDREEGERGKGGATKCCCFLRRVPKQSKSLPWDFLRGATITTTRTRTRSGWGSSGRGTEKGLGAREMKVMVVAVEMVVVTVVVVMTKKRTAAHTVVVSSNSRLSSSNHNNNNTSRSSNNNSLNSVVSGEGVTSSSLTTMTMTTMSAKWTNSRRRHHRHWLCAPKAGALLMSTTITLRITLLGRLKKPPSF